jgi:hypothetical protein
MYRRSTICAAFAVTALATATTGSGPAIATTPEEYERRIEELESRIARLEAAVERFAASADSSAPRSNTGTTVSPATAAPGPAATPATAGTGSPASPKEAVAEIREEDDRAIEALYLIRDKAVTLTPGGWEADFELSYTRDDDFLQTSYALGAEASLSYGLAQGLEIGLTVPYDYTSQRTETGSPGGRVETVSAFGDISLDVSKTLFAETEHWPGVVFTGTAGFPTGPDPYHADGFRRGSIPSDPFTYYLDASGHYSVGAGIELIRTVDPFAFFAGVNIGYELPREVTGVEIAPGWSFGANIGGTFAVSEATSLGFSLTGSYNQPTITGGKTVWATETLPLVSTFSVLQRLGSGFYLQPALAVGLTADAPDATLSLTTTKSF